MVGGVKGGKLCVCMYVSCNENDRASDAETGLERERGRESSIQADSPPNRA